MSSDPAPEAGAPENHSASVNPRSLGPNLPSAPNGVFRDVGREESGTGVVRGNVIQHVHWTFNGEVVAWPDDAEAVSLRESEFIHFSSDDAGAESLKIDGSDDPSSALHFLFVGGQSTAGG
jgi:hypothetical protein